jgi:hypothetical protein
MRLCIAPFFVVSFILKYIGRVFGRVNNQKRIQAKYEAIGGFYLYVQGVGVS